MRTWVGCDGGYYVVTPLRSYLFGEVGYYPPSPCPGVIGLLRASCRSERSFLCGEAPTFFARVAREEQDVISAFVVACSRGLVVCGIILMVSVACGLWHYPYGVCVVMACVVMVSNRRSETCYEQSIVLRANEQRFCGLIFRAVGLSIFSLGARTFCCTIMTTGCGAEHSSTHPNRSLR